MNDIINSPDHYTFSEIEPIKVIENWGFAKDHYKASAIKYLARAGRKKYINKTMVESEIFDIEKAIWYLKRKIKFLECLPESKSDELNLNTVD